MITMITMLFVDYLVFVNFFDQSSNPLPITLTFLTSLCLVQIPAFGTILMAGTFVHLSFTPGGVMYLTFIFLKLGDFNARHDTVKIFIVNLFVNESLTYSIRNYTQ